MEFSLFKGGKTGKKSVTKCQLEGPVGRGAVWDLGVSWLLLPPSTQALRL